MKAVLVNYNYTPDWLKESGLDYIIYDRSDSKEYLQNFPQERIIYTKNVGNVDYDKLSFLVDFYDTLPDVFLWGKTNLFKYISPEEFAAVRENTTFTPLLTQGHSTYSDKYGVVCFYQDGMYHERKGIVNTLHIQLPWKFCKSWEDWCRAFFMKDPAYIPFPPGGNFLLTREAVHRYGRDFYDDMRKTLDYAQTPLEAQFAERSYYLLWK